MDGPKNVNHAAVVPGTQVRLSSERTRVGPCGNKDKDEPQVILIRNGDTIEAIEVICTCGKRTRLNCIF